MMWSTYIAICLLVSLSTTFAEGQEGSSCTTSKNETGICTLLSQCPQVMDDIKKGQTQSVCGSKDEKSIVCCGNNQLIITTEKVTPKKINEQKCLEYGKSVYAWKRALNHFVKMYVNQCYREDLLVRGDIILQREYPHLALIGRKENDMYIWDCLGSLISEKFVLTAAHCLDNFRNEIQINSVRLGAVDINSNSTEYTQDFPIVQKFLHPDYKSPSIYHDIGLIQLDQDVKFTAHVRPACLQNEFNIPEQRAIAHGWNKFDRNIKAISFVKMIFTDVSICSNSYPSAIHRKLKHGVSPETQICASPQSEIKYCQDVSGSPLETDHKDVYCMYKIIGITSFGTCARSVPALYTRVSNLFGKLLN